MLKKFLIIAIIVAGGLMLGTIISISISEKDSTKSTNATTSPDSQKKATSPKGILKTDININPTTIKVTPENLDGGRDLDKIDKATVTLQYENQSSSDLKDIKVKFSNPEVKNISFAASDYSKFSPSETKSGLIYVFTVPDLKAGEKGMAKFLVFSGDVGTHIVIGEIKTNQGVIKINPVIFTVE